MSKNTINRRNFLGSSLAAAATVTTGAALASSDTNKTKPVEEQPKRMSTQLPGTISIEEALTYNMSLPVSTTIIGVDDVAQIEQNVRIASGFSPLSQSQMDALEFRTLPIVRQGLYFRCWELGE